MELCRYLVATLVLLLAPAAGLGDRSVAAEAGNAGQHDRADSQYGIVLHATNRDYRNPAGMHRALDLAGEAGIGWVRIDISWGWVEGTQGRFNWHAHDALVAKAREEGLEVLAILGYGTQWNTTAPPEIMRPGDREHYPPRDYEAWGRYVYETVSRYKDSIDYWQVWNEPDLGGTGAFGFWRGTPAQYARLLAVADENVKRADPDAKVVLGGLSLGGSPAVLNENFLTEILNDPTYPVADHFDVADFHHYGSKAEAKRRYDYVKGELAKAGVGDKPIWVTEVGSASDPALERSPEYQGPEGQARYLRDFLPYLLGLGVERVFWFSLSDPPGDQSQFRSHGLLDVSLNPKPAYAAYRDLIASAAPLIQEGGERGWDPDPARDQPDEARRDTGGGGRWWRAGAGAALIGVALAGVGSVGLLRRRAARRSDGGR